MTAPARQRLEAIVAAYDAYRGRGVLPAPGEYAAVVAAIEQARSYLAGLVEPPPVRPMVEHIIATVSADSPAASRAALVELRDYIQRLEAATIPGHGHD